MAADLQQIMSHYDIAIEGNAQSFDDGNGDSVVTPVAADDNIVRVSAWQTLLNPNAEQEAKGKFSGIKRAAMSRQCDVQRRMEKTFAVEQKVSEAVRSRKGAGDVQRMIAHSRVVTTVQKGDEQMQVSYRDQGNVEMYSSKNMRVREGLRHHPDIMGALDEFWNILPKTPTGRINKSIYTWFCRAMYFQLVPTATETEFQAIVSEDWKNDALYSHTMNIRMFRTAIFNTADVWCETTEHKEYRDCIRRLRKVVENGPRYAGKLEEDDETDQRQRRAGLGEHGRTKSMPSGGLDSARGLRPGGAGINAARGVSPAPEGEFDEDVMTMLHTEESLMRQMCDGEADSALDLLGIFSDVQGKDEEFAEDIVQMRLNMMREKRRKFFGDGAMSGDRVDNIEENYIAQMQQQIQDRSDRRNSMLKRMRGSNLGALSKQRSPAANSSHRERVAQISQDRETKAQQYLELSNVVREAMFTAGQRNQMARTELVGMEVQRLKLKLKAHIDPYEKEQIAYLHLKIANTERKGDVEELTYGTFFTEFVHINRGFQAQRDLMAAASVDPLYEELLWREDGGSHFSGEEELQFGTKRWERVMDWFARSRRRVQHVIDDKMESIDDTVRRVAATETKHLWTLHEQQSGYEAKMLEIVTSDALLLGAAHEEAVMDVKKYIAVNEERRQQEVEGMTARHAELTAELKDLQDDNALRMDVIAEVVQCWNGAISLKEAADGAFDYYELLEAGRHESGLGSTVFGKAQNTGGLNVSAGGSRSLPSFVTTLEDFAMFVAGQEQLWFSYHTEHLTAHRYRLTYESTKALNALETKEFARIVDVKVTFRIKRVNNMDEFMRILAAPKCPVGFMEKQLIQTRVKDLANVTAKSQDAMAWRDESLEEEAQQQSIWHEAQRELRVTVSKMFNLMRVFGDRIVEVQQHFARHHAYRATFDARQVKHAEALGEATAKQQQHDDAIARAKEYEDRAAQFAARRAKQEAEDEERRVAEQERLDLLKKQKAEAQKKESIAKQQQRKLLLAQQETKQKEKLTKERADKDKWRKEYMEEEKKREAAMIEQQAWSKHQQAKRRPIPASNLSGAKPAPGRRKSVSRDVSPSTTPKARDVTPLAPSSPKPAVRRKSQDVTAALNNKVPKQPKKKAETYTTLDVEQSQLTVSGSMSPAEGAKMKLVAQLLVSDLSHSGDLRAHEQYADRRLGYLMEQMSNKSIYKSRCTLLKVIPDTEFMYGLSDEKLEYVMSSATIANRKAHLDSMLDVVRLNPVQHLYLRKAELTDADLNLLCESMRHHEFICHLDLRDNRGITAASGAVLIDLVRRNPRIVKLEVKGTGINKVDLVELQAICQQNTFGRDIGYTEFEFIMGVFNDLDRDGSGLVSHDELRAFATKQRAAGLQGSPSMLLNISGRQTTLEALNTKLEERLEAVKATLVAMAEADIIEDGDLSLAGLICMIYPHWTVSDAEVVVQKYTGFGTEGSQSGPSTQEMQEFIDMYGTRGTLTLQQLATGLGEAPSSLRTVFGEFDIDNDGRLSLDEFMRFMSA
jgi:Ca2+-binding EF-hand superfamily protein